MSIADPNYTAQMELADRRREAQTPYPAPPDALKAPKCRCDEPQTYRDEDGELRCCCGRAV